MRQLIQSYRTGEMQVEDVPSPVARPGGVVVRTVSSLVSAGTEKMVVDLAKRSLLGKARARPDLVRKVITTARKEGVLNTVRKMQTKLDTPIPLGYSSAGIVVEVGERVHDLRVGDRVACGGAGYANHADYAYVPRNLVARVPDDVSFEHACFATVAAIALQGVRQAEPTLGERVAVLGLGLIGQLTVQLLRANGCQVIGFDPNPARAELARGLGAHLAVSEDLEGAVASWTGGSGVDAVIVAASSPSAGPLEQAGEISRLRGRVVVVGLVAMQIPRDVYYLKELDLRMSMSYGPGRYDADFEERGFDYPIAHVRWTEQRNLEAFLDLAKDGRFDLDKLISHRFEIDKALDAYALISSGSEPYLAVLLGYGVDEESVVAEGPRAAMREGARTRDTVGIGLVGAGNFGQSVLLPALKAAGGTEAIAITSATGMTAQRIGEQYGFRRAASSHVEVIGDEQVDVVLILTRHDQHAAIAVEALRAGKSVFTEKPLALDEASLAAVEEAREQSAGDVMVGFNRRFAPLSVALAEHFEGRSEPLVMSYRINAGLVPDDHWIHDPIEGGGRIVGEVCHFIDLLQFLAGAPPVRVHCEGIGGRGRFRSDDNVVLTLAFGDGSVATVLYSAAGDSSLPKERVEVFGAGRVAVLDDFRSLETTAGGRTQRTRSANQDKGFEEEMRQLVAALKGGARLPLPFVEAAATTRATFAALESLRTGRAVELTS